jgi:hypothetical protein
LKVDVVSDDGSIGWSNVALTGGLRRTAMVAATGTVEVTVGGVPPMGGVGDGVGPAIVGEPAGTEAVVVTAARGNGDDVESEPQPAAPSVKEATVEIAAIITTVLVTIAGRAAERRRGESLTKSSNGTSTA